MSFDADTRALLGLRPTHCEGCSDPLPKSKGRPRKWCSRACMMATRNHPPLPLRAVESQPLPTTRFLRDPEREKAKRARFIAKHPDYWRHKRKDP